MTSRLCVRQQQCAKRQTLNQAFSRLVTDSNSTVLILKSVNQTGFIIFDGPPLTVGLGAGVEVGEQNLTLPLLTRFITARVTANIQSELTEIHRRTALGTTRVPPVKSFNRRFNVNINKFMKKELPGCCEGT